MNATPKKPASKATTPAGATLHDGGVEQPARKAGSTNALTTALAIGLVVLLAALPLTWYAAYNAGKKAGLAQAPSRPAATAPAAAENATNEPEANLAQNVKDARLAVARQKKNDPMAYGKDEAPVTMVEYADFRCPFCAVFSNKMLPSLQKYIDDGTLRIEYHDMPIFGEESTNAAIAARAAGNQGKYHDFVVKLYAAAPPGGGHPDMPKETLLGFAQQAGVPDMARFEKDLADPALAQAVNDDLAKARQLGLNGTPAFFINTQFLSGAQPVDVFSQFIEYEKQHNPRK